jgi:hypothetical protein
MIEKLCMPALIYLIYSTTHVIIDTYKGFYNTAFIYVWQTILFTYLLQVLCQHGLGIISWLIVSIPFILMTVIATILLAVFGLNPATGKAVSSVKADSTPSRYAVPISI